MRRLLSILVATLAAISLDAHAQRQLEPLGRGLVAVRTGTASTYIGWRLLGNDPDNIAFNIYRSIGTASPIKLNPQPLTNTTDFQDTTATFASSLTYHIRPLISGIEQPASPSFTLRPNPSTRQCLELPLDIPPGGTSPDGTAYTYTANDASTGDLDGDGEYEIILRWEPTNSWGGGIGEHTGPVLLDAYQLDGTRLWRINLGPNVNRVNRFLAGVAYLDGKRPSRIFARGYYTRTVISAWDWRNADLTKRWTFDSDDGKLGNPAYRGQGAHSLSIGDLDQDGLDEISYGA